MGEKEKRRPRAQKTAARDNKDSPPSHAPSRSFTDDVSDAGRFPIVGLGASAGGLKALEEFFFHAPVDAGIGFVVVTHQHPGHRSMMAEILGRKTSMPVVEITQATRVLPDHVYTVPSGNDVSIADGVLQPIVVEPVAQSHTRMPIDSFFRSLARDQKSQAVGIILSGTGADGSLGLKEIKAEFGLVMVQEERSAEYGDMPHSAIATALVDYALPPSKLPEQLVAYVKARVPRRQLAPPPAEPPLKSLQQIFALIRDQTGHDFSQYKRSTIGRRIERRMNLHDIQTTEDYGRLLRKTPGEVDLLVKELLIGVTSFFRDPEAWEILSKIIDTLLLSKPDGHVIRAWVPGCSTGEEAYSLAILLRERMEALDRTLRIQLFATDLDTNSIDVARAGIYPQGIVNDVSPERLARFFTQKDHSYCMKKELREMLVFAQQNLISDPPFTKLDLLSCRNLLIYFDVTLQKKLLPIFHYALKPKGILFLGPSESTGSPGGLFRPLDKKWKIHQRLEAAGPTQMEFSASPSKIRLENGAPRSDTTPVAAPSSVSAIVARMLLQDFVPPTVLTHERGSIVYVHGETGQFFQPPQGAPATANVLDMARPGLELVLSTGIREAATTDKEVLQRGVRIKTNGHFIVVSVRVKRLTEPTALRNLFRISFEEESPAQQATKTIEPPSDRLLELERELQHARESHQGTIEELETSNEELKSTNEELQSTNEELQSTNEELETSKEEMQSLNEELQTVNAELHRKVDELSDANNDMKNLLNATSIATVFLDENLCIKRFTEQATRVIRLIPTDLGRPIGDLVSTLHYHRLIADAEEVLRTLVFKEIEVRGQDGAFYLMRILPYRTTENMIDGLVLTFVDVTTIKNLQHEQDLLRGALRNSQTRVLVQDLAFKILWASGSVFGKDPAQIVGTSETDHLDAAQAETLRSVKEQVVATANPAWHRVEIPRDGGRTAYDVYVEPNRNSENEVVGLISLIIEATQVA